MISLTNVSKSFRTGRTTKVIADNVTIDLRDGQSVALLGRNGAGKSSLLKLIAGTDRPDQGRISCAGSVSWPVGFSGSFHGELTGEQNVRFVARIYGVDTEELVDYVADFADLDAHFRMPVRTYSSGMRSRLAFGVSMGVRFDTYLVDEVTSVGDAQFREKSEEVFVDRMRGSGAIIVSHGLAFLERVCDAGMVLERGRLTYFDDIRQAIAVHRDLMSA